MQRLRPGLAGWLALVTALLVTAAVSAVSIAGMRLLRELADAEALARVELAVSAAREALRQNTDDLVGATRVLAERPTLGRLLGAAQGAALAPYLERYCDGAALDACAVVTDSTVVAAVGLPVHWPSLLESARVQGQQFFASEGPEGASLSGVQVQVAGHEDTVVIAVRRMDAPFAARLSERVGTRIRITDLAASARGAGRAADLDARALAQLTPVSGRVGSSDSYAASLPIIAGTGEVVALLQAELPASEVTGPLELLQQRMVLIAGLVALLATSGGILMGRYWIAGVRRLTEAARRIGSGDLATSVPGEHSAELAVLASTMEEMRRNLVSLTGEIRRREVQAQAVLGGIVEGVYAVDRKRRIRFLNPQAEKLLKISAAQAFGRFCGDVLNPAPDARGRRPCEHACPIVRARRDQTAEAVEHVEPVSGRIRRVVIASASASDGIQVQVLRDETELEAVRRTRDTVLANISHEFRTPLAAQLASIELLREGLGTLPPGAQRELVASLERGAQRLTWLIDNLLESVRIESGQLSIRRNEVVLGEVVDNARELVEPLLGQRGQQLDVQPLQFLPLIRGDRERLCQVLVNLLANASKFSPVGSVVWIGGGTNPAGFVELWVEDEGPGPADPSDTSLFERFHRSGEEDPAESGLGLGLFIVNSIVERHGGNVRLFRTSESRTRAQVELPINGAE